MDGNQMPSTLSRDAILDALAAWIEQRPGLDPRDYSDGTANGWRAYRSEARSITKDLQHARTLLAACRWRHSMTVDCLREGFRAFSGRLTLTEKDGRAVLDYCTGQYWPTEYRRAACAVLASAIWHYTRECLPEPAGKDEHESALYKRPGGTPGLCSAGDWIRSTLRREFGATIQTRWMD